VRDAPVTINQQMSKRDGVFITYAFAEAIAFVTDATKATELKLRRGEAAIRYRFNGGEWKECKGVIGVAQRSNWGSDYAWSDTGSLPLGGTTRVALRADIPVTECEPGSCNAERAKLPPAIKPPLDIEFYVLDTAGVTHRLAYSVTNKPLEVVSRDKALEHFSFKDKVGAEVLAFVSADNTKKNDQDCAAAFLIPGEGIVLKRSGFAVTITLENLQYHTFAATKAGKDEIQLSDSYDSSESCFPKHRAFALVAREYPPTCYGIRIEVETETSKATETFHVKLDGDNWIMKPNTKVPAINPVDVTNTPAKTAAAPASAVQPATREEAPPGLTTEGSQTNSRQGTTDSILTTNQRQATMTSPSGFTVMYSDCLGRGANGAVYRGYNNALGQFVAVKESLIAENAAMRDAIAKEFSTLTNLAHPNIVNVYALEIEGACCRIFMEWLPSGSLRSVLNRTGHRMHEGAVRRYFRDALRGLAYLHDNGLCHLDIKPGNMLLTADGTVKLADFGTSRLLSRAASGDGTGNAGTLTNFCAVGTPAYMPPEMISNGKYYEGSDMWALACSIVEMASGKLPWSEQMSEEVLSQPIPTMFFIASAQPPKHHPKIPEHLSNALQKILHKCFASTIASRPSARSLLGDDYFTSDGLPLDVEKEDLFAKGTVAAANAASAAANSGSSGAASANPSWTGSSGSVIVVSSQLNSLTSTQA
jgi:serine/threonine protein kinase